MFTKRFLLSIAILLLAVPSLWSQTISYITPDIGAPGMNTYVEFIAAHTAVGTFGTDGFYLNNSGDALRVECADAADTQRVTIGPVVVSWNGRMLATQIFVHPDQQPPSYDWNVVGADFQIPLRVVVNGLAGNSQVFTIVRPQSAVLTAANGTLGSGGIWGVRSPRGAMIFDSLQLDGAQYDVSLIDPDASTPGNQAYLPAVILSKGPIRTASSTIIQVNGSGKRGGPGGGGGGGSFCDFTGDGTDGGDGFTGGGRGGRNRAGNPFGSDEYRNPGLGSGAFIGVTGGSLNGVSGGTSPAYEATGGGTGHPFGTSGEGCGSGSGCNPPGGYGGGSGQQQTMNGGGGGYATAGQSSRNNNGGNVHGNAMIVPFAGGSGGGGGNPQLGFACSGDGGGGGGALRLYGRSIDAYLITADGAGGGSGSSAHGGGGSGGAISAEAKFISGLWKLRALGGSGVGSNGGGGRLRMDGPIGWFSGGLPVDESLYFGPSTDTTSFVTRNFTLTGTGNGNTIDLYVKSDRMPWTLLTSITGYSNTWSNNLTIDGGDGVYYLVAVQRETPQADPFAAAPTAVLSQAAANILVLTTFPRIEADVAGQFGRLLCEDEVFDTLAIDNTGEAVLRIPELRLLHGDRGFRVVEPVNFPLLVPAGESRRVVVAFTRIPGVSGRITDTLIIPSNDPQPARNPWYTLLTVDVDEALLESDGALQRFPDLWLCDSTSIIMPMTLYNRGTVPLDVNAPGFGNPAMTLDAPAASAFPLRIAPGDSRVVYVRITPPGSGPLSGRVSFSTNASTCNAGLDIELSGDVYEAALDMLPAFTLPTLYCFGQHFDTVITVRNTGNARLRVTDVLSSDPAFAVLAPPVPADVNPGEALRVQVRYAPLVPGTQVAQLTVVAEPCALRVEATITGRRDSVGLTAPLVDFGARHVSEFPVTQRVYLRNTGTVPIRIDAVTPIPPFTLLSPLPLLIAAGDSVEVLLRFDDPGSNGNWTAQLPALHDPQCAASFIAVAGIRGDASVELVAGDIAGVPGQLIELPIYLRNAQSAAVFGATSINTQLRFDASLLVPQFANTGVLVGTVRSIPITVPLLTDANDVALRLPFLVTLGAREQTVIEVLQSQPVGGRLTIVERPGSFTLEQICREGGTRLFDGSVRAGIRAVRPNPFNPSTEILVGIAGEEETEIFVTDLLGRRVATLASGVMKPGEYSIRFDAQGLPSGMYIVVLRTADVLRTANMLLSK